MSFVTPNIKDLGITSTSRVLIVYPHADDETMSCGGLIQKLVAQKVSFKVLILTKGEATTNKFGLGRDVDLVSARETELRNAMTALGVKNCELRDFPDGGLETNFDSLTAYLKSVISGDKYDVVVTYEPCGVYGHPDHIALTRSVEKLLSEADLHFTIIYSTVPKQYKPSKESLKMAKDPDNVNPLTANYILQLHTNEFFTKLKAIRKYKSQLKFSVAHMIFWILYAHLTSREYFYIAPANR